MDWKWIYYVLLMTIISFIVNMIVIAFYLLLIKFLSFVLQAILYRKLGQETLVLQILAL